MKKAAIALGCDHAGFDVKEYIKTWLTTEGFETKDFGTFSTESVDYPDFVHPVAQAVENGNFEFGILICGSGNGVAITANKHARIRAAIAWNPEISALSRQHNDANILCLPARFINKEEAVSLIRIFLNTPFEGGRHAQRVNKIPIHPINA